MVDKETIICNQKLYYNWSQNRLNVICNLNNWKRNVPWQLTVLSGKWSINELTLQMNTVSIQEWNERASTQPTVLSLEWGDERGWTHVVDRWVGWYSKCQCCILSGRRDWKLVMQQWAKLVPRQLSECFLSGMQWMDVQRGSSPMSIIRVPLERMSSARMGCVARQRLACGSCQPAFSTGGGLSRAHSSGEATWAF